MCRDLRAGVSYLFAPADLLTCHAEVIMGGPAKRRAEAEKATSSSGGSSGRSHDATERSTPKSIPRLDGNRDPIVTNIGHNAIDYSRPQDLKNISEALGYAGWCVARGVSTNAPLIRPFVQTSHCSGLCWVYE